VKQSECGIESFFNVELGDAGDGTIEITISGPSGQLIPNNVINSSPGLLEVHYVPTITGMYNAAVTYNGVSVPGSPTQFKVVDTSRVMVRGDGLGLVQCGHLASFLITAPDARLCDLDIAITSPVGKELVPDITESAGGNFRVEYKPSVVGTYTVRIACFNKEIPCSPFIAKAWDASRVLLADVMTGQVGIESSFKVVVTEAGEGVLEITLNDPMGHLVANQVVTAEPGVLDVVYIPKVAGVHRGNVLFNGEKVPASPFTFAVIDIASVSCWGDGLGHIPVKKPANFSVTAVQTQLKDLSVRIAGPNGREVMSRVSESSPGIFRVDYTPQTAGEYFVTVFYYGKPIPSCPVLVQVWDISKVRVSPISMGFCGVQSNFTVDAREAGDGKLEVKITGPQNQQVICDLTTDHQGAYIVSFIPSVAGIHNAIVLFNGEAVSGSPFAFTVADPENVSVCGKDWI
jgi:filamin